MITATNPTTGEKIAYIAGKWVPLPGSPKAPAAPEPTPDEGPGFLSTFKDNLVEAAGKQNIEALGGAAEATGVLAGKELTGRRFGRMANDLAASVDPEGEPYQPQSLSDVVQNPGASLGYALGQAAGSTLPSIAAGVAGGVTGGAVGGPIGATIGTALSAAGASYVTQFGQNYRTFLDQGADADTAAKAAAAVALPQSILDTYGLGKALSPFRSIGARLLGQSGEKAAGGIAARVAKGAVKGAVSEGVTEAAQQGLQEAASSQIAPLYDPEGLAGRLAANAAVGAVGGGAFGTVGGALDRPTPPVTRPAQEEAKRPAPAPDQPNLAAIAALPDAEARAVIREQMGVNGIKANAVLKEIRAQAEAPTKAPEAPTSAPVPASRPADPAARSQSQAIAEKAGANALAMLKGSWIPLRETEDPNAPIVGYINEQTGQQRTVEEHRTATDSPLSGLEPTVPTPEQIVAQRAAVVQEAEPQQEQVDGGISDAVRNDGGGDRPGDQGIVSAPGVLGGVSDVAFGAGRDNGPGEFPGAVERPPVSADGPRPDGTQEAAQAAVAPSLAGLSPTSEVADGARPQGEPDAPAAVVEAPAPVLEAGRVETGAAGGAQAPAPVGFTPNAIDTETGRPAQVAVSGDVRSVTYEDGTTRQERATRNPERYRPLTPEAPADAAPAQEAPRAEATDTPAAGVVQAAEEAGAPGGEADAAAAVGGPLVEAVIESSDGATAEDDAAKSMRAAMEAAIRAAGGRVAGVPNIPTPAAPEPPNGIARNKARKEADDIQAAGFEPTDYGFRRYTPSGLPVDLEKSPKGGWSVSINGPANRRSYDTLTDALKGQDQFLSDLDKQAEEYRAKQAAEQAAREERQRIRDEAAKPRAKAMPTQPAQPVALTSTPAPEWRPASATDARNTVLRQIEDAKKLPAAKWLKQQAVERDKQAADYGARFGKGKSAQGATNLFTAGWRDQVGDQETPRYSGGEYRKGWDAAADYLAANPPPSNDRAVRILAFNQDGARTRFEVNLDPEALEKFAKNWQQIPSKSLGTYKRQVKAAADKKRVLAAEDELQSAAETLAANPDTMTADEAVERAVEDAALNLESELAAAAGDEAYNPVAADPDGTGEADAGGQAAQAGDLAEGDRRGAADESAAAGNQPGKTRRRVAKQEPPLQDQGAIQDAGEKIGGARKDQWRNRALTAGDLEGMTAGEERSYVTKDAVFPAPDYAAMVADGTEPVAAATLKLVRDRLAAKPADNPEDRRRFIKAMGAVREQFAAVKTFADVKQMAVRVANVLSGDPLSNRSRSTEDERAAYVEGRKTYKTLLKAGSRTDPLRVSDWGELRKATQMVEAGWPGSTEPWKLRWRVMEPTKRDPTYAVVDDRSHMILKTGLASMEEAEAWAAENWAKAKERAGEGGEVPARPHLDDLKRTGKDVRGGRDIGSEDFIREFGFRGVEFGNWVASDERQKVVNIAYEGLHDLADTLGIPPRALSLAGKLGIAFGARGSGRFAAHYEPDKLVINMTKLSGAGSLAHEWAHALDHYFGELNVDKKGAGAAKGASGWYTPTSSRLRDLQNLRPEMAQAFDRLMSTLFKSNKDKATAVRDAELRLEKQEAEVAKVEAQAARFRESGDKTNLARFEKWLAATGRPAVEREKRRLAKVREMPEDADFGAVQSSFYQEAIKLSGSSGEKGYWARPTELFARSLESYVSDRISDRGEVSQYLVHGVEGTRYAAGSYKGNPYPTGQERERINAAFDDLFKEMKVQDRGDLPPALFQTAPEPDRAPTVAETVRLAANVIAGNLPDAEAARLRDEIAAELRPLLKRLAGDRANLKVFDAIRATGGTGVSGVQVRDLIGIALLDGDRIRPREDLEATVRHEAIHFMREANLIPAAAWSALESKGPQWRKAFGIDDDPFYAGMSEVARNEEAVAEAFSRYKRGTLKVAGSPLAGFRAIGRFLDALRGLIARVLGIPKLPRPSDIFDAIERGDYSGAGPETSLAESRVDRTGALETKLIGDLVRTPAFREQGLGALNVPSKRMVLSRVFRIAQDPKVLDAVVRLIPVDVVDVLTGGKLSAKELFNDEAVFQDLLARNGDKPVAVGADAASAAVEAVATVTAKRRMPFGKLRPPSQDGSAAVGAGAGDFGLRSLDAGPTAIGGFGSSHLPRSSREADSAMGAGAGYGHEQIVAELEALSKNEARFQTRSLAPGALLRDVDQAALFDDLGEMNATALGRIFTPNMRGKAGAWVDNLRRRVQDRFLFVRRAEEDIERALGRPLTEAERPYLAEEGHYSKIGEMKFRNDKDFFEPIARIAHDAGISLPEIDEFLTARHAEERNQAIADINPSMPDGGSGMTNQEAKDALAKLNPEKRKALDQIGDLVDRMMERRLTTLVDSGIISAGEADAYRAKYKHYVPLRGKKADPDGEVEEALRPIQGRGFMGDRRREKRALGRKDRAPDVLATTFTLADEAIVRGQKNAVGQALLNLALAAPDPAVWKVDPVEREAYLYKHKDGRQEVRYRYRARTTGKNIVSVRVDGREFRVELNDPDLFRAFERLGGGELDAILTQASKVNSVLSRLNTMWSPVFLVTNALRDVQAALVNLGEFNTDGGLRREVMRGWKGAASGSWHYLKTGKADTDWSRWFQEFRENGGATAFNQIGDVENQKKTIEDSIRALNGASVRGARKAIKNIAAAIERTNESVDNAIRLSTYVALRKRGQSPAKAASIAKNLTVNFNRKGELGPALNALFMFFNASVQGTATLGGAMIRSKTVRRWAAAAIVLGALQEILNGMWDPPDDDPDKLGLSAYDRVDEWKKQSSMIWQYGPDADDYFSIPMPYGYGFLHNMGRIPAAYLRGAKDKDGKPVTLGNTIANLITSFASNFIPPGLGSDFLVPSLAQPFVDIWKNEDYFGRPIAPTKFPGDDKPDSQTYYPSVNLISRNIAQFLNSVTGGDEFEAGKVDISPESLSHIVKTYAGAAGSLALSTFNNISALVGEQAGWNAEDPDLSLANVPLVNKFVGAASPWQARDITYQRLSEVEIVAERAKANPEIRRENRRLLALVDDARKVRKELGTLRKDRRRILADEALSVKDRRARTDRLDARERDAMAAFNARYIKALP